MIYLAIDNCCHGCEHFKVEDVVNGIGDHTLMCSFRQKCWEKRQTYLTVNGDIFKNGLTGLGDR